MTTMGPAEGHDVAWWAALQAEDLDRLRALLQAGADPNLRGSFGQTILHRVAGDLEDEAAPNNLRIAQLLLESGADVDAVDANGRTPLMLAAESGSDEMTALLLQNGADTAARDREGCTALMHGLGNAQRVFQLLDQGADLDARDSQGRTPLIRATERCYLRTLRLLLERGADVQAADARGDRALPIAMRQVAQHEATLQTIEKDATSDQPQYGPAHRLLWLMRERAELLREVVRVLVQYGSGTEAPDDQGSSPLRPPAAGE
jgi:uncharacterized protein